VWVFYTTEVNNKYVYLSSLPRSGSTLLSMLLGSHDNLFAAGEFILFGQALRASSSCTCGSTIYECDFWGTVIHKLNAKVPTRGQEQEAGRNFETLVYPFDFRKSLLQRSLIKLYSYSLIHRNRLLSEVAAIPEKGYPFRMKMAFQNTLAVLDQISCCFSDPETIFLDSSKTVTRLNQLYMQNPFQLKVIQLVRDGRGTVNSWLKSGSSSFTETVNSWRFHIKSHRRSLKKIKPENKIRVRYEDLCTNPVSELTRLCDFLQVSYQETMLRMEGPFHMLGGNPGTMENNRVIQLDNEWERMFTQDQLTLFDKLAGPLNKELGY